MLIYDAVARVFASLNYTFEIIFVNDGSTDDTQNVLEKLSKLHPEIKTIEFSRNFGHQPAVKAGLDLADGDAVISMDADLQHPAELIPTLIAKWEEGYDVVYTIRKYPKQISMFKRKSSSLYYRFWALLPILFILPFYLCLSLYRQLDMRKKITIKTVQT